MPEPAPAPMNPVGVTDLTGKTVGRFVIRARLGGGGMGEVYRADDTQLKRPVALKRIAPRLQADMDYRQRFLREAQCASALTNQHVAGIYDVLEDSGEMFLVMEYVEGVTLRQRLAQPLSLEQFLGIALQCASALVAAHERAILHRDLKPENIMLTPAGQVKILDFGVAKQLPRTEEGETGEILSSGIGPLSGTLAYMAPEVLLEKQPDRRADIFSLGLIFYEALTGRHPFLGGSLLATSSRILHDTPAPLTRLNPKVPGDLERIVAKMLAKDPHERYATAADLLVDLRAVQRAVAYPSSLPASDSVFQAAAPRWNRLFANRRLLTATVGVILVVAAVAGIAFLPQVRQRLPRFNSPSTAIAGPRNLAVLPFQAVGGASENQAYSDGITETLTAKLTQLTATHNLQVVPAREVRSRRVLSAQEARKELGVSLVLEGSLDRSGNRVRVNYALVDTGTRQQLRADTITAEASDPFAVQDRVAGSIVRMLDLELKPQERKALQTHGTQVAGAYDFYLQGRGYLQNYDRPENIEHAISVFKWALSLDPGYALAHAGLGEAYWKKYEAQKDSRWVASSHMACEYALVLDVNLAAAHECLGTLYNGTGQYEKAVAEFQRALETEPTSDAAARGLGYGYEHLGSLDEAEQTFRQAIALRPHYWASYSWLGAFYFRHARYTNAAEMFNQVVALAPDSFLGYSSLGAIYAQQGRYEEAITMLERSVAIRPTASAYSNLATAYFRLRRFEQSSLTYEEAVKLDDRNATVWGNLGDAYYWTPGRRAQAASAYRKAIILADEALGVNPGDVNLLGIRALCHAMLEERKLALADLSRGLKLAPGDPNLRFKAALIYNQLGQVQEALAWLDKALAVGHSPSTVRDTPNFQNLQSDPRFQELFRKK